MQKKLLIVEDEPMLLEILVDRFNKENFEVITAINGQKGLDQALKYHPDIILLDILMPIMGGMEMLNELRKDSWGENALVILLTNLTDPEKEAIASCLGVCDYLIKSDLSIENVIQKVRQRLESHG